MSGGGGRSGVAGKGVLALVRNAQRGAPWAGLGFAVLHLVQGGDGKGHYHYLGGCRPAVLLV